MTTEPQSMSSRAGRASTEAFHRRIVDRALVAIRMRFGEEDLRLSAIADAAISSPFHFARLFRQIAGVPPGHFLTAVRMQAAKQLLADTRLSVTNVCLEVGYTSIGTFTRRFTELVGVGPRAFRRLAAASLAVEDGVRRLPGASAAARGRTVRGNIHGPCDKPIAVGLFPTAVAQGRPVRCCIVRQAGPFEIRGVPDGRFYVMAAALDCSGRLAQEPEFRGASIEPVEVSPDRVDPQVDITLRPPNATDPPIVVCIPVLAFVAMRPRAPLKAHAAPAHVTATSASQRTA